MSCCKPAYREIVKEKEEEINAKGQDKLPFFVKMVALVIIASSLTITIFLL